jgi:tetratricopeptide (TPR) repeat protein
MSGKAHFILAVVLTLSGFLTTLQGGEPNLPDRQPGTATVSDGYAHVEHATNTQSLFSPLVAKRSYELARELAGDPDVSQTQLIQALVLLDAAVLLDSAAHYVRPLQIETASRITVKDYTKEVSVWLSEYISESADLEIVREGIIYLIDQLNTREDRETLLRRLALDLGSRNNTLDSELSTLLAALAAERADFDTARSLLANASKADPYNHLAFSRLAELSSENVSPTDYMEHIRFALRENPTDIEVAVSFARYAEQLMLYESANESYRYCANLFTYLYPGERLPSAAYLPWAVCAYNTERNQNSCLDITNAIRQGGRFDLLLEAIAGKAAARMGNADQARRILGNAATKAERLLNAGPAAIKDNYSIAQVGPMQLAWFYCFASPNANKALDWAYKAYTTEPDSPAAGSILAYALVLKDHHEWAKPLIESDQGNQIATLVRARIQLKEGNIDKAVQTLKAAILKDPSSFAAEEALSLLRAQGLEYVPSVDPEVLRTIMAYNFGDTFIPRFIKPEDAIGLRLSVRGNKFAYGAGLEANVAVVNNTAEPLVVSDHSLFKGKIRIDAAVTGDISRKMPELVARRVRTTREIGPGQSLLVPTQLVTGELRRLLLDHPQASLNIEFTLYIDPVTDSGGKIFNRVISLKPARLVISRPGVEVTGQFLRSRLNTISTGQVGQKIKTAQLFIGLLKEQQIMSRKRPLYRFRYADWMPTLLTSALLHESGLLANPSSGEWVVKAYTMADMLGLQLDQEITSAVAENITNVAWPVRMMALCLLSSQTNSQFGNVLEWVAQHDASPIVREIAQSLQTTASSRSTAKDI